MGVSIGWGYTCSSQVLSHLSFPCFLNISGSCPKISVTLVTKIVSFQLSLSPNFIINKLCSLLCLFCLGPCGGIRVGGLCALLPLLLPCAFCWQEVEGQRKQTVSPHVTFPSEHSVIHLVRCNHFSSMLSVGSVSASCLRNQQSPVRGVKPPTDPQLAPHAAVPLCPHLFAPCCSSPWKAPGPNSSTFFPLSMKICGHRQEPSSASLELVGGPCASFPGHLTTASLPDAQSHLVALGRRIR